MATINYSERYTSMAVAKARKDQIERQYHPCGYGTNVKVVVDQDYSGKNVYIVEGYRFDSCD